MSHRRRQNAIKMSNKEKHKYLKVRAVEAPIYLKVADDTLKHIWACEEESKLVLFLQRQSKPVDYTPQDFKQFNNTTVFLHLKNKPVEDIVDGFSNEWPMDHELPIYLM
ncbi:hypothetical protein V6N13_133775 [Hibiscus sabdariffa]|uniref:Uncharacterized protein n=1 Tax=Hibiscus sabdariffa TaxID=183260 RepID=A0ABR2R084_9ROSI